MKISSRAIVALARKFAAVALLSGALTSPSHAIGSGDTLLFSGITFGSSSQVHSIALDTDAGLRFSSLRSDIPGHAFTSFSATLYSTAGALIARGDQASALGLAIPNTFSMGLVPAGSYHRDILGTATGHSGYAGSLGVAGASAPEPEVWAMMLVGAGLVGIRIRRKSRVVAIRSPA